MLARGWTLLQHNKKSRYLPEKLKSIIYRTLQRSPYFGHPENILLAMQCCPTTENIWERERMSEWVSWSFEEFLKRWQIAGIEENVRKFKIPTLNFKPDEYIDLIDWHSVTLIKPPFTVFISHNELKTMILDVPAEIDILRFPCHSQALERTVKLVT